MGMIGQFTPALRTIADVRPFRCVKIADRGECDLADATDVDSVIGVTDGSNRRFDDEDHANNGEPVRLQPGTIVLAEAGETISAPQLLRCGVGGMVYEVDDASDIVLGQALEDATAANQIIRIWLNPDNLEQTVV